MPHPELNYISYMTLLKIDKSTHKANIKKFVDFWSDTANQNEIQGTSKFWIQLLRDVLCVERPDDIIDFERPVKLAHVGKIDAYIKPTKVLIEQKSGSKSLLDAAAQSDGSLLTPFQQAKRYADELPYSEKPRFIVTCNFACFFIYDMEKPKEEPQKILLNDLAKEYARLQFLVQSEEKVLDKELEVSIKAGALVGEIYDAFSNEFKKIRGGEPTEADLHSLNVLCVRLVFCLYAEDAGIFAKDQFCKYMQSFRPENMRIALKDLFKVLDTPDAERDPFLEEKLKAFPYVNGSLFKEGAGEVIPTITEETANVILNKASLGFDWSDISPTIFGAVFESTLNQETRRKGGMHYTSIENIHKVIDPLFMDDLRAEFEQIKSINVEKTRDGRLKEFQQKMGELTFFDPACGSGNFLTETYISMRTLENEALKLRHRQGPVLDVYDDSIYVNIHQFYGIEINDFAATVAKTALWIAESQMIEKTGEILQRNLDFLPLKSYSNITVGNALQMDWNEVASSSCHPERSASEVEGSKKSFDYIMGNPPFVGARLMAQGSEQKKEIETLFGDIKDVQDLDYVCGWYKKAAVYIQGKDTQVSFVSTNSICQGSQVPVLWNVLLNELNVKINFAYQTFKWASESSKEAAVFCVIVGFGTRDLPNKKLFDPWNVGTFKIVDHISPYLMPGTDAFVTARNTPLCDVPKMCFGNQPRDGGHLILSEEERAEILKKEPNLEKYIKVYMGSEEFINNKKRYCIWLKNSDPADILNSKILGERVSAVREFRAASKAKTTNGYAKVPHLFAQLTQPDDKSFLIVPRVSSERRTYVPIGFCGPEIISNDAVQIIPDATLFHFGVLTSSVHMAWMRAVCGRLEMRYRYSKDVVYNNFPWPAASDLQNEKIERSAQSILDARSKLQNNSLAQMYGEKMVVLTDLCKAHHANDMAVMDAYGFPHDMTESEIVARLLEMYQQLVTR